MSNELSVVRWVIWIGGCCAWIFGLCDRSIAASADHWLSAIDIVLLGTASLITFGWLTLIPVSSERIVDWCDRFSYRLGLFL